MVIGKYKNLCGKMVIPKNKSNPDYYVLSNTKKNIHVPIWDFPILSKSPARPQW